MVFSRGGAGMSSHRAQISDNDLCSLIEIICNFRKESFPCEKLVALLTFITWLHWPEKPDVVQEGRLVAAALVVRAANQGRIKIAGLTAPSIVKSMGDNILTISKVADSLVQRKLELEFSIEFEGHLTAFNNVSKIVEFFVRCPEDRHPSLNKAMFFIDEGGFSAAEIEEDDFSASSPATLKKNWSSFAAQSPFLFAAAWLKYDSLVYLAPDDDSSIDDASVYLKNPVTMQKYFGVARRVQELLLTRLYAVSRRRFPFLTFPATIAPVRVKCSPLTPEQLEVLQKYRSPKSI